MTRARNLSRLGNINAISVSEDNLVGIGSTIPGSKLDLGTNNILSHNINSSGFITATNGIKVGSAVTIFNHGIDVAGVVTATSFVGDGANITGLANTDIISAQDFTLSGVGTFSSSVSIADSITHLGDNSSIRFPAADTFTVETSGSEALRITSGGLVGIGTQVPGSALEVFGSGAVANVKAGGQTNARVRIQAGNTSSSFLEFGDSDDADVGEIVYDHSDNHMHFNTNATEKLRITSGGNVGVALTDPGTKLEVSGGQNQSANQFTDLFRVAANANNDSIDAEVQLNFGISPSHTATANRKARIQSVTHAGDARVLAINPAGGDIGIGTDTPSDPVNAGNGVKLAVGIVSARQYFGDGSNLTGAGHAVGSGQTTITSTATFNNSGSFARFAEMDASYTTVGTGPILVTCSWSLTQSTSSSDLSWKLFRKIGGGAASEILVNPSLVGSSSSGMIPNFRDTVNQQGCRISYSFIDSPGHSAGDLITYEHHINCEGSNTLNLNHGAQTAARHCTTVSTITFLELAS